MRSVNVCNLGGLDEFDSMSRNQPRVGRKEEETVFHAAKQYLFLLHVLRG
jgi:hypothetical protein